MQHMKFDKTSYVNMIKSWADQDLPTNQQLAERLERDLVKGYVDFPLVRDVADMYHVAEYLKISFN